MLKVPIEVIVVVILLWWRVGQAPERLIVEFELTWLDTGINITKRTRDESRVYIVWRVLVWRVPVNCVIIETKCPRNRFKSIEIVNY